MEIQEFAQRVLFATSLEEKLAAAPEQLTDSTPGKPMDAPGGPGRPVELRLLTGGERAPFPADPRLVDEEQRGILLHFFANHELLATELMALVLLKFPDAPKAFRRGIVRTLHEEQQHTRWYLRRMKECGVRFGEFSLNRFFWDAIAPMETPLDYVTRLSLTFEQANLDYSRHYAEVMRQAGDSATARILDQIHRDEIGHVGYGLRWFRKWKESGTGDWDAYRNRLRFPLSPSRGKGNVPFNAESRRRAGLDELFIREIEIFSRSKGRTPFVHWFCAEAEGEMARGLDGSGFTPRAEVRAITLDLEIPAALLAHRDDLALLRQPPSAEHRRRLHDHGLPLPDIEILGADGLPPTDGLLRERRLRGFRPWAWSPGSADVLGPLAANLPRPAPVETFWNEAVRSLFSKVTGHDLLTRLLSETDTASETWAEAAGVVCRSIGEFQAATPGFGGRHPWLVAKAPFGAAGQQNHRFPASDPSRATAWATRILKVQGAVIVQPWRERVLDFSVHYDRGAEGIRRRGFVHLANDRRGQFQAATVIPKFCHGMNPEVARFLMGDGRGSTGALSLYDQVLPNLLETRLATAEYEGPIGIDAFVFRDGSGSLRLLPLVEMNPRFTMGRLALELHGKIAPGHSLRLELIHRAAALRSGAANLPEWAERRWKDDPARIDHRRRLCGGTLCLNDPVEARHVLAVARVAKDSRQLLNA